MEKTAKKLQIRRVERTSSIQLQNGSFHVVKRTRTAAKCTERKSACANRVELLVFIVKYANLCRSGHRRRRGPISSPLPAFPDSKCVGPELIDSLC